MIKRICMLAILCTALYISGFADEQRTIKLDNDKNKKETVELSFCNIFLELKTSDNNGDNVEISLAVENLDESKSLYLFERAYSEKVLKKMSPRIAFDKIFGGTKGQREIEACNGLKQTFQIAPSQKEEILILDGKNGETTTCRLPIYISKYKEKNYILWKKPRYIILEKQVIELNIEVSLKPDSNFIAINSQYEEIIKDLSDKTFCTNKRHRPSLKKQKEIYQSRIETLIEKIDSTINYNGWFSTEKKYAQYNDLRQKLQDINLEEKEGDCGKHAVRNTVSPKCKYCSYTLQQISHELDDAYQKIYSSSNRDAEKSRLSGEINAMYKCAQGRRDWQKSDYKSKITRLYNEISKL